MVIGHLVIPRFPKLQIPSKKIFAPGRGVRLRITDPLPYTSLIMKKISKLKALPFPDQKVIFRLCETHSYPDVCKIIAQPRTQPDGLAIETNPSALCRFNQAYGWLAGDTQLLQQFADILDLPPNREGFLEPVVRMVERLAFRQLLDRKPFNEILPSLRVLISLERLNFSRLKWRENNPLPALPSRHVDQEFDCVEIDQTSEPQTQPTLATPATTPPTIAQASGTNPSGHTYAPHQVTRANLPNSSPMTPAPDSSGSMPPAQALVPVSQNSAPPETAFIKPATHPRASEPATPTSTRAAHSATAALSPGPVTSSQILSALNPVGDEEIDPEVFEELLQMAAADPNFTSAEKERIAQGLKEMAGNFTSCSKLHTPKSTAA